MKFPKNLVNMRFGKLVVIERQTLRTKNGRFRTFCLCKCDCGNTTRVQRDCLIRLNGTKSCSCLKREPKIRLTQEEKIEKMKNILLSKINVDLKTNCWNWTGVINSSGYGQQTIYNLWGFKTRNMNSSRLCAALFLNFDIKSELSVLHKCDNRTCINPAHLFFGSHQDNMQDMDAKNRRAIGSRHGMSKLTEADIIKIRSLLDTDISRKEVARRFDIDYSTLKKIQNKKLWKHA